MQFGVNRSEGTRLRFELHRLSLQQFVSAYLEDFSYGYRHPLIDTEDAPLAKSWSLIPGPETAIGGIHEVGIPEDVDPGIYVLSMKLDGMIQDQLFLLLTRNTIAVKQGGEQLVVWVSEINGVALPEAEVRIYTARGVKAREGVTDESGIYRTTVNPEQQPVLVLARGEGEDVTAAGLTSAWKSGGFSWWRWWGESRTTQEFDYTAHIYTERPIYRPGQRVLFKAILRADDDALLSTPKSNTPVTLRIRDARDNVLQTFELRTNSYGSVHGEFQLGEGVVLGDYSLEVVLEGETHRQTFKVQDYRKPDIDLRVTTDAQAYVRGDTIQVDVEARYFFGEPLSGAEIQLTQFELVENHDNWWTDSGFEPESGTIWFPLSSSRSAARTDAQGRATLRVKAQLSENGYEPWYSNLRKTAVGVEVRLSDASRQEVSAFAVVTVYSADEKLQLDVGDYLLEPGGTAVVKALVTSLSGEALPDHGLKLELRQWDRGTYDYDTVVLEEELTSDEGGHASLPMRVNKPGFYQVRLSSSDRRGNLVFANDWIYVHRENDAWQPDAGGERLSIRAERTAYEPYEKARLFIESSFSGPALLTFERGETRREKPVELTAPLTTIEVPILWHDAPNIFVTVNAWRPELRKEVEWLYHNLPDSHLLTDTVELSVAVTGKTLDVTVSPDREEYGPGEEATFTVQVRDSQGKPVAAELSFALVDEAVFRLSEDLSPSLFESFYSPREHLVKTYDSMAPYREIYPPGRGGGGGDGSPIPGDPRSDFPDTAIWMPVIQTDARGQAVIQVTLPDNLTSWRATVKAFTRDTKVGQAAASITTRKDLVIRPFLPRTLVAGDRVELSAFVHNNTAEVLAVVADLSLADGGDRLLGILGPDSQAVILQPGEVRIVGWSAKALLPGIAQLLFRAAASGREDAVRLPIPIRQLAIPSVSTQTGEVRGELSTVIAYPEDALSSSLVRVEISRTVAGTLFSGLEYLTGFPYGCVEQTMSRALPNAVVGRAFYRLGITQGAGAAELEPKIRAGLQRLYGFQHEGGGWGWWYDDESDAYQTAWVVFGLSVTREAGYEVDENVIQRGAAWLKDHLDEMDPRTQAYSLYSMSYAGHGEPGATVAVARRVSELDTFSQAALALALKKIGMNEQANDILGLLADTTETSAAGVFWPNPHEDGHYHEKTMSSSTRSTALALTAFAQIQPAHELVPGITRWLMAQRRQEGWGTTNETSFAILALTDHLLSLEEAGEGTEVSVEWNGERIASAELSGAEPALTVDIPAAHLKPGLNALRILENGDGTLYYRIISRTDLALERVEAAGEVGITRRYANATGREVNESALGELVQVTLSVVVPEDMYFVILEDKLPGGLEALNESLNTASHPTSPYESPDFRWEQLGYNNKEVWGDRVSFFVTDLPRGSYTFSYLARATHRGAFQAAPAELWAMYDPSGWGRSASDMLSVVD